MFGFIVLCWLASGILCGFIAKEKRRDVAAWFISGLLLGIFAIVAICAVGRKEED